MASSKKLIMLCPYGFVEWNEFLKEGYLFKFLQIEFNLIQYQFSGILDFNEIHLQRQVECADFENQLLISL